VYPNLGATRLVGYDGMAPGPTFMMRKGTEAVVRFINHADRANSVHLHGSYCKYRYFLLCWNTRILTTSYSEGAF
jgi:bilirubin oxidase